MASTSSMEVSSTNSIQPQARRKRQLNLVKCERCRHDKVECAPRRRVWPDKCIRCISKDLPCSKGSRVERMSKHTSMKQNSTVPAGLNHATNNKSQFQNLEVRLRQRNLISFYHQNTTLTLMRLKTLKGKTTAPFFNITEQDTEIETSIEKRLRKVYKQLGATLNELTNELLTTDLSRTNIPTTLFPILIASSFTNQSGTKTCPTCFPSDQERLLNTLEEVKVTPVEFFIRQNQICGFYECDHEEDLIGDDGSNNISIHLDRYLTLTDELMKTLPGVLRMHKLDDAAEIVELNGLFHPDVLSHGIADSLAEPMDWFERSKLHRRLDNAIDQLDQSEWALLYHSVFEEAMMAYMNDKDILGRTPLHIMCQMRWQEGVERLLNLGADPNARTIYGSLPLHYAAANGSAGICDLLLKHGNKDADIITDCQGVTAFTYARAEHHEEVLRVLTEHHFLRIRMRLPTRMNSSVNFHPQAPSKY